MKGPNSMFAVWHGGFTFFYIVQDVLESIEIDTSRNMRILRNLFQSYKPTPLTNVVNSDLALPPSILPFSYGRLLLRLIVGLVLRLSLHSFH